MADKLEKEEAEIGFAEDPISEKMTSDEESLLDGLGIFGEARRKFLGQAAAMGLGAFALNLLAEEQAFAAVEPSPEALYAPAQVENGVKVVMKINGAEKSLNVDSRMTLLDALRERLALTGSKKGCDHGQCGACTVLADGVRINSCLTLAVMKDGAEITTIEGLANGDELHPVQAAFIEYDAFQCGYCTSGQICSAIGMLAENRAATADDVRELMSGNICRCGAYPNIVAAIEDVRNGQNKTQTTAMTNGGGEQR